MKNTSRNTRRGESTSNARKCLSVLLNQAKEFCLETGLPGFKYIAQTRRSKTDRIIWAMILFSSFCCCIVFIKMSWDYFNLHPMFTFVETTHRGIWHFPFPAVTLCDINRMSLKLTQALVANLKFPPESTISKESLVEELRFMIELIHPGIFGYNITTNLTRLQDIIDYNNLTVFDVMQKVTVNCTEWISSCQWNGKGFPCTTKFRQSLTRDGLCCSTNYFSANYEMSLRPKPIFNSACGSTTGLSVFLKPNTSDYLVTLLASAGSRIFVHDPFTYPDYNANINFVNLGKQVFINVMPQEIYSSKDVRDLAIPLRKCLFQDEGDKIRNNDNEYKYLTKNTYRYINCIADCQAATIKSKCGCIPYYYGQNGSRICNLKDVACLTKFQRAYDKSWTGMNLTKHVSHEQHLDRRPCGCMPNCKSFRYPIETSEGRFDPHTSFNGFHFSLQNSRKNENRRTSLLHVFFGDLVSIQYCRNVNYNWRNLFASFGGLLGLFVGFSLMSAFELIYFFVIRIIIDIYIRRRNKK